jgi:hypothetical protein
VFFNPAESLQVWVNEEDHLRIIFVQDDADIEAVYARLLRACLHIHLPWCGGSPEFHALCGHHRIAVRGVRYFEPAPSGAFAAAVPAGLAGGHGKNHCTGKKL